MQNLIATLAPWHPGTSHGSLLYCLRSLHPSRARNQPRTCCAQQPLPAR